MELDDDSHVQSTFARVWNWRVYSRSLFIYVGSYLRGFQRSGTLVGGHAFRFLTILSIESIVCALCALTMSLGYRYFPARADCNKEGALVKTDRVWGCENRAGMRMHDAQNLNGGYYVLC